MAGYWFDDVVLAGLQQTLVNYYTKQRRKPKILVLACDVVLMKAGLLLGLVVLGWRLEEAKFLAFSRHKPREAEENRQPANRQDARTGPMVS